MIWIKFSLSVPQKYVENNVEKMPADIKAGFY